MKIKIYILSLICGIFCSCDGILDLTNEDAFVEGNFWQTEAQVAGYITGMHKELRDKAHTFYLLGEQRGGLLLNNGTFGIGMDELYMIEHTLRETSTISN